MAVELVVAIEAVKAVTSLVKASANAAERLGEGWRGQNKQAKEELQETLQKLQNALGHASDLARVADAYSRAHEKVATLHQLCDRAHDFVRDNMDVLSKKSSPDYPSTWRLLETLVDSIDDNRDFPLAAVRDREQWYDSQDKAQIEIRMHDFNQAHRDAMSAVSHRLSRDLERAVPAMIEPLREVEVFLESTMYDKVFRALETLGADHA